MIRRMGWADALASSLVFCRPCCVNHVLCVCLALCDPLAVFISGMPTVSWPGPFPEPDSWEPSGFLSVRPCVVLVQQSRAASFQLDFYLFSCLRDFIRGVDCPQLRAPEKLSLFTSPPLGICLLVSRFCLEALEHRGGFRTG